MKVIINSIKLYVFQKMFKIVFSYFKCELIKSNILFLNVYAGTPFVLCEFLVKKVQVNPLSVVPHIHFLIRKIIT